MPPLHAVARSTILAVVAGTAGCGLKDYGTRTGPLPVPSEDAWLAMKDAPCYQMTWLGYEQRGGTVTPTGEVSCFGEWVRVRGDTTDALRLDHTVSLEGRQPGMGGAGSPVIRIAIMGRTTVRDGTRVRHVDASEHVRCDADTVMLALRDLYLKH